MTCTLLPLKALLFDRGTMNHASILNSSLIPSKFKVPTQTHTLLVTIAISWFHSGEFAIMSCDSTPVPN